jgi:predicted ABC-type transport system involved in lysophospholipase L1 biosynthesis ATPase subunit
MVSDRIVIVRDLRVTTPRVAVLFRTATFPIRAQRMQLQSFNLLPTLTAAENVELPLRIAGRRPDRDWLGGLEEGR